MALRERLIRDVMVPSGNGDANGTGNGAGQVSFQEMKRADF